MVIYRFGDCQLDEQRRSLTRRGAELAVQPKVLDLLLLLLWHRTRVVPKELLFRDLWPDATVSEASLTRLVKEARRCVGDNGRRQAVIRTANRRGYRFVAEVEAHDADASTDEERAVDLARRSLEAFAELHSRELRTRVGEFEVACLLAIQSARRTSAGVG